MFTLILGALALCCCSAQDGETQWQETQRMLVDLRRDGSFLLADLDQDGDDDLLVGATNRAILVFENDGNGTFGEPSPVEFLLRGFEYQKVCTV